MWLSVNRQSNGGACCYQMLAELTFLPMLILSHTDAFVANFSRSDGSSLKCSNIYKCTNDSGIYTLVTGTQVLLNGQPACDTTIRNSMSLEIQRRLNDACTSAAARETTNFTLNFSDLSYLSNCTGITTSANLSFMAYYNCTSTKPATLVIDILSTRPTAYSPTSTSHTGSSLSSQAGRASTNNASANADQSSAQLDHRITVILATVIPLLVIFGAVAVTLGVLARKNRIHCTAVSNCLRFGRGSFTVTSEPPLTRRTSEPEPESAYASLHELGVKPDDHIYGDFVQRTYSSNSAASEVVYENGPVHLAS